MDSVALPTQLGQLLSPILAIMCVMGCAARPSSHRDLPRKDDANPTVISGIGNGGNANVHILIYSGIIISTYRPDYPFGREAGIG